MRGDFLRADGGVEGSVDDWNRRNVLIPVGSLAGQEGLESGCLEGSAQRCLRGLAGEVGQARCQGDAMGRRQSPGFAGPEEDAPTRAPQIGAGDRWRDGDGRGCGGLADAVVVDHRFIENDFKAGVGFRFRGRQPQRCSRGGVGAATAAGDGHREPDQQGEEDPGAGRELGEDGGNDGRGAHVTGRTGSRLQVRTAGQVNDRGGRPEVVHSGSPFRPGRYRHRYRHRNRKQRGETDRFRSRFRSRSPTPTGRRCLHRLDEDLGTATWTSPPRIARWPKCKIYGRDPIALEGRAYCCCWYSCWTRISSSMLT